MPLIPTSFVFSVLLCLSLYRFIVEGKVKSHYIFFILFVVLAIQSILIGLSWGYGMREALVPQSILATAIPPLIWLSYQSLIQSVDKRTFVLHSMPCIAMMMVHAVGILNWIDPIVMVTFFSYGLALLYAARKGEDILNLVRHDSTDRCFFLFRLTGWMLIASTMIEIITFIDFMLNDGKIAGVLVSVSNLFYLLAFYMASFLIQEGKVADESPANFTPENDEQDDELPQIAEQINTLMQAGLYKDLELNTTKIARKVGVPVRKISQAINRTHGKSVSQYVNQFRIDEACHLLATTEESITQIALNSGFMSKSNFHREFSRMKEATPTQWRKKCATEYAQ